LHNKKLAIVLGYKDIMKYITMFIIAIGLINYANADEAQISDRITTPASAETDGPVQAQQLAPVTDNQNSAEQDRQDEMRELRLNRDKLK
jgi:hypothetical protein